MIAVVSNNPNDCEQLSNNYRLIADASGGTVPQAGSPGPVLVLGLRLGLCMIRCLASHSPAWRKASKAGTLGQVGRAVNVELLPDLNNTLKLLGSSGWRWPQQRAWRASPRPFRQTRWPALSGKLGDSDLGLRPGA